MGKFARKKRQVANFPGKDMMEVILKLKKNTGIDETPFIILK